ncbi:MAG TPA: sigma-70 family RNA polymerase sigma factor [Candidatus Cybelea sp.]|nr:sigma-70 family RNA polymerase sigma factor [Candidatus Cybelea sp.]
MKSPEATTQIVPLETAHRLLDRAAAPGEWNLSAEQFQAALERSVRSRFTESPGNSSSVASYLAALHLSDLALACACSAGDPCAWDFFVAQYRPELFRAARAIAGEANARELADSLYAELYGLRESGGVRASLLDYFHGRSKLATWLRAILAQRHVDALRRARRTESLDDRGDTECAAAAVERGKSSPASIDPERLRHLAILQAILQTALDALSPRDRLRLAYYYAEGLTLAEIGKLTGEHEATVSRKLERTRRGLRAEIDRALRARKLSDAQVELCYEIARDEWPFDLTAHLEAPEPTPAKADGNGFQVSEVD